MSDWNFTDQLVAAGETVTVLLAGPRDRTDIWLSTLSADNRFRVVSMASTPDDFRSKLAHHPAAILVDAVMFPGPSQLLEGLKRIQNAAVYILLPQMNPAEAETLTANLKQIPAVHAVYQVDINLASLVEKMYGDARTLRAVQGAATPWNNGNGNGHGGPKPVSTRIVTVWNQMGGVGKTTIAGNMAFESARRGYATLLVGLGAPDDLPLVMGVSKSPNITRWHANPTVDGLRSSVQKVGSLDILAGFPDVLSEAQAMNTASDSPTSVRSLVDMVIRAEYSVIVIDAPPTSLAAASMTASNTLVIVGRPAREGAYRTAEAFRTVADSLSGLHNIPTNRMFVVLNRLQEGHRLTASDWHRLASEQLGRPFPPISAQIPDLIEVGDAQDRATIPLTSCNRFAEALKPLADTLFSGNGTQAVPTNGNGNGQGRVIALGPIKVKV